MKLFSTLALLAVSALSSAALAATPVFSCHSDKQRLEVYQMGSGFQGQLTDLYGGTALNCQKPVVQGGSLQVLWRCVESRQGNGRILVQVEAGGATGLTTTTVSQESSVVKSGPNPAPMHPISFICL